MQWKGLWPQCFATCSSSQALDEDVLPWNLQPSHWQAYNSVAVAMVVASGTGLEVDDERVEAFEEEDDVEKLETQAAA